MTHTVCASSDTEKQRLYFRKKDMGQPPDILGNPLLSPIMCKKNSHWRQQQRQPHASHAMSVPFKELEKMVDDLKKENFDLKLRLFYLEDTQYQYQQLASDLEACQHELATSLAALERKRRNCAEAGSTRTVGTQTTTAAPCSSTEVAVLSPTSYHTAFESFPVFFGSPSNSQIYQLSVVDQGKDHSTSFDLVTDDFSKLHFTSPVVSDDKILDWLDDIGSNSSEAVSPVSGISPTW